MTCIEQRETRLVLAVEYPEDQPVALLEIIVPSAVSRLISSLSPPAAELPSVPVGFTPTLRVSA